MLGAGVPGTGVAWLFRRPGTRSAVVLVGRGHRPLQPSRLGPAGASAPGTVPCRPSPGFLGRSVTSGRLPPACVWGDGPAERPPLLEAVSAPCCSVLPPGAPERATWVRRALLFRARASRSLPERPFCRGAGTPAWVLAPRQRPAGRGVASGPRQPAPPAISLCPPRAAQSGSSSPTSGARRRTSCRRPRRRRRPARASRCCRPPPPPPVSSRRRHRARRVQRPRGAGRASRVPFPPACASGTGPRGGRPPRSRAEDSAAHVAEESAPACPQRHGLGWPEPRCRPAGLPGLPGASASHCPRGDVSAFRPGQPSRCPFRAPRPGLGEASRAGAGLAVFGTVKGWERRMGARGSGRRAGEAAGVPGAGRPRGDGRRPGGHRRVLLGLRSNHRVGLESW